MKLTKMIELMISLHKKVDVNTLSDAEWREYQQERREIKDLLQKMKNLLREKKHGR